MPRSTMPKRQFATCRETGETELEREIRRADYLCKREEIDCIDAESLDSDDTMYETESSEESDSYDDDFIDDSEPSPPPSPSPKKHIKKR